MRGDEGADAATTASTMRAAQWKEGCPGLAMLEARDLLPRCKLMMLQA
jgi:hypothetical protein